jgi:hypothetical protein
MAGFIKLCHELKAANFIMYVLLIQKLYCIAALEYSQTKGMLGIRALGSGCLIVSATTIGFEAWAPPV